MNYTQLLEEVKSDVSHIYSTNACKKLPYHNLVHTQQVVANALRIIDHYKLNDTDSFIVEVAAWFHDTGYCNGIVEGHERDGAKIAEAFLGNNNVDSHITAAVSKCIMATALPQKPTTLLEQIICDADLYHFGADNFGERNKLMRKEMEWRNGKKIPKGEWRKRTMALMEVHHFQTDFCKSTLQETKNKNIEGLKHKDARTDNKQSKGVTTVSDTPVKIQPAPESVSIKKEQNDRLNRGIETMFKITSGNNQRLSDMADSKANIMISTTSIILSILLSVLFRKLEESPQWVFPAILLLSVCVITMILAILATRPALPSGRFTYDEVKEKKTNLLFFGNFYKMTFEDYNAGMEQVISDREVLYSSLTKDIYSQGVVLGKKYLLLRLAYNVFMYGIILSVAAFIIASFSLL
jgi:predicted metal-dependent HD superfamily phosphohydrolase